jgi:hypothetical protein
MSSDDVTPIAAAENATDKTVLELLLHSKQWPWSVEEVGRELGDRIDAADSVGRLSRAGLVHRHDGFVFPTRAAIRAVELDLAGD